MPALKMYPLGEIYSVFRGSKNSFVFGYKDQVVGSVHLDHGGPRDCWSWSLYDCTPQPYWRRGTAETLDEAKRVIAERFRRWLDLEGGPKPIPPCSRFNVKYISELKAKNADCT
jgi:hypothetical protein